MAAPGPGREPARSDFAPTLPPPPGVVVHVLHPGDVRCATRGERLDTLLGSCVAVMLTDPRRTVGAMCHIVHRGRRSAGAPPDTRHAEDALAAMFAALRERGVQPRLCDAHLAGGGNMFPTLFSDGDVGTANALAAMELLAAQGIALRTRSIGGPIYRKVAWTIGEPAPVVACVDI